MSATGPWTEVTVWCSCGDEIPEEDLHCATCCGSVVGEDRIAAVLVARPSIIGRARIQPAEAARMASDLWDALSELDAA